MEYRAGFPGISRIERQPVRHGRELKWEPGLHAFRQIGTAGIRIADENPLRLVSGSSPRSMSTEGVLTK